MVRKIKAFIKLYEAGRKNPIRDYYRPLFNFIETVKNSGSIKLLDRDLFYPGDEGVVEISFWNPERLGNEFRVGKKFTFGEGIPAIGEGEILEIMAQEDQEGIS